MMIVLVIAAGFFFYSRQHGTKVDDWRYNPGTDLASKFSSPIMASPSRMQFATGAASPEASNIGFAVGGSKDINNFRANIENNYLPISTDMTYEGLFYDYYFDTGETEQCNDLFCPSYTYAISEDPFSGEEDYYLSVGLNSGIKDFERKKLNLVIVLDISGSMNSPFNKYYYDQFGNQHEIEDFDDSGKTKMEVAAESVVSLLDHLEDDDRFGMVLFESKAHLAKPLSRVGDTDLQEIRDHILEISPRGGTQMSAGMELGTELYNKLLDIDSSEYENRIIFLTDAMPNRGETSKQGLLGMTEENSENGIYSTFIGIGVDFNTELIEHITKIRGANYHSVHSAKEFDERMDEGFDYMVTPLVFNLNLQIDADGYEIEKVYGSPEANEATGEIMKVNTLFPSRKEEGETKGGIVLLKLKKISDDAEIKLIASYEDREGNKEISEVEVTFTEDSPNFYENKGIRKGILLARYADLMKNWINDERESLDAGETIRPSVDYIEGIVVPEPVVLGQWERRSTPLVVSNHYIQLVKDFRNYFEDEMDAIDDATLHQEVDILNKLIEHEVLPRHIDYE